MGQVYQVEKIQEGIWEINEETSPGAWTDAYLICGTEKALLVDCLQEATDVYEQVRKLTDLPVEVIITHGHGDHAGKGLEQFKEAGCPVYMSALDVKLLDEIFGQKYPEGYFLPLTQQMEFDLGGVRLQVIPVGGHTPGSLVVLDEERQMMFSGDSIGSGHFWMQIKGTLPLAEFRDQIQSLYEQVKNLKDLCVYPGHRYQSPVQLNLQYVEDVLTLTGQIVAGQVEGEDAELNFGSMHMIYKHLGYGLMTDYCYDPKRIV